MDIDERQSRHCDDLCLPPSFKGHICRPGAVLGLAEAISGGNYQTSAVAATNIEVQFVSSADIIEIIRDDSLTGMELVQMLSAEVATLYQHIRGFRYRCFPKAKGRLAALLTHASFGWDE
jgi:hypothetical protein